MEMKKLSYEELEGKEAVIKSNIFVLDFKVKKMLELKGIKDAENWSISELADVIDAIETEIEKLEADNKKLREIKLQKISDEQKKKI